MLVILYINFECVVGLKTSNAIFACKPQLIAKHMEALYFSYKLS